MLAVEIGPALHVEVGVDVEVVEVGVLGDDELCPGSQVVGGAVAGPGLVVAEEQVVEEDVLTVHLGSLHTHVQLELPREGYVLLHFEFVGDEE